MVVTPDPERELRLEEIPRAIRRAGFVPAEMRLRARGAYVHQDGGLAFRIRGWPRILAVRTSLPAPQGETLLQARVDYSGRDLVLEPLVSGARLLPPRSEGQGNAR